MESGYSKILIVDDEPDILEILSVQLNKEGFDINTASNGERGLAICKSWKPDLIIVDIMMPVMNGYEMAKNLSDSPELRLIPFLFLTAKGGDENQLSGFELGAEDYIQKPVSFPVLLYRIKNILRRSSDVTHIRHFRNCILDIEKRSLSYKGKKIDLARKEFNLLSLLSESPGKVFGRQDILKAVWGDDVYRRRSHDRCARSKIKKKDSQKNCQNSQRRWL